MDAGCHTSERPGARVDRLLVMRTQPEPKAAGPRPGRWPRSLLPRKVLTCGMSAIGQKKVRVLRLAQLPEFAARSA